MRAPISADLDDDARKGRRIMHRSRGIERELWSRDEEGTGASRADASSPKIPKREKKAEGSNESSDICGIGRELRIEVARTRSLCRS